MKSGASSNENKLDKCEVAYNAWLLVQSGETEQLRQFIQKSGHSNCLSAFSKMEFVSFTPCPFTASAKKENPEAFSILFPLYQGGFCNIGKIASMPVKLVWAVDERVKFRLAESEIREVIEFREE